MPDHPHKGHRDRLKKRFLQEGFASFEPHNILELILFYAIPQKDTNPLAHKLINHFGSLHQVLEAPYEELLLMGTPKNAAILLTMVPKISNIYLTEQCVNQSNILDNTDTLGRYLIRRYLGFTQETVCLILLNANLQELGFETVTVGGLTSATLDIRKIIELSIRYQACSIVLSHNHPHHDANPSNEDVIATAYLQNALKMIEVTLLDHIIVSHNSFVSLKQLQYL